MRCEWCQAVPAVTTIELEPAKYRIDKRTRKRVMAKPPKTIHVCRGCEKTVERQMADALREKERAKQPVEKF